MQVFLKKHGPGHSHHSLKVNWSREGRVVKIEFQIQKRTSAPWLVDENFGPDWSKNWGLWNKDVFEVFLQLRKDASDQTAPYLEIQVSPRNQPFALVIVEPRKTFHPPQELNFQTEVVTEGRTFIGKMEVTLPEDLKGDLLFGGFFSCLGENPREFYALEPNPEQNPDFHRPELFLTLDE